MKKLIAIYLPVLITIIAVQANDFEGGFTWTYPETVAPIKKQPSWITQVMTRPLKAIARKYIGEQQTFLKQEVDKYEPQIKQDIAEYGHIKSMQSGSPEHIEWLANIAKEVPNPYVRKGEKANLISYGAANPIMVDVSPRGIYNERRQESLAYKARELYNEKRLLEVEAKLRQQKPLYKRIWQDKVKNEKDQNRLAWVNAELDFIDHELEAMPAYYAQTRMQQQNVRQERLKDLEKRYKYPTDYYLNNTAFANQIMHHAHSTPYKGYVSQNKRWLEETTIPTIQDEDKSGFMGYYTGMSPAFDPDLTNLLYDKSDELLKDKTNRWDAKSMQRQWDNELTRLENKKRARAGKKPTQYRDWYRLWDHKREKAKDRTYAK